MSVTGTAMTPGDASEAPLPSGGPHDGTPPSLETNQEDLPNIKRPPDTAVVSVAGRTVAENI
jgi:hypothetical protein